MKTMLTALVAAATLGLAVTPATADYYAEELESTTRDLRAPAAARSGSRTAIEPRDLATESQTLYYAPGYREEFAKAREVEADHMARAR